MHPILARFGPFSVYSYGLMVALGFSIAAFLIYRRARIFDLDKNRMIDLCIAALVGGIAGARMLYVLLNIGYYASRPIEIFYLSRGGLVWYGGFLGGLAASVLYAKRCGLNFLDVVDLMAPYLALAQALGRIGCFLNGCCFGIETRPGYPLGVIFPGSSVTRHPVQAYSAAALVVIFLVLKVWQGRRHFRAEIFLGYCILYSSKRFIFEFLRGDSPKLALGLSLYQYISLAILAVALAAFALKALKWKRAH